MSSHCSQIPGGEEILTFDSSTSAWEHSLKFAPNLGLQRVASRKFIQEIFLQYPRFEENGEALKLLRNESVELMLVIRPFALGIRRESYGLVSWDTRINREKILLQ